MGVGDKFGGDVESVGIPLQRHGNIGGAYFCGSALAG